MSDQEASPTPLALFCSYADADQRFKQELEKHLKILLDQHAITFWSQDQIQLGSEKTQVIREQLLATSVILLLLSPDFFNSNRCQHEMEHALERQHTGAVRVFLILVRPCPWQLDPRLQNLPLLPELAHPVILWRNRDQAWLSIVRTLCQHLRLLSTTFAARRPVIFQARALPPAYVPRPAQFNAVKRLLLSETSAGTVPAITTALRGAGGFGKTTLALALCHDAEIQAAFPDGILWIELGEQPPRPLDVLNGVLASLDPSLSGAITLEEVRDRWRTALSKRVCLLVIDDVWQARALSPLLEGGPQCMRLVTTRNDQVLPAEATRLFVDAMQPEEAIAVLCHGLPEEIQQEAYQPKLQALASQLGYWPLLLTLAHGLLADQVRYGRTNALALTTVEHAYQHRGITAFHLEQESERHRTADACLEVSVRHLSKSTPARYQAETRYQELAIFPEDTDLPLTTLHTFWQGTGELEIWEVDELCVRLHQLSLLLTCDLGKGTIRLHDVTRNYLQQKVATRLPRIHQALLNAYHPPTWADLPPEESYLWKHLFFHLKAAGRIEELLTTTQDFRYLANKAFLLGSHLIEADLQEATTLVPHDRSLARLRSRIAQIGHLLNRSETLVNIQCLFLSYLCDLEHYREQCAILEKHIDGVYIKACHSLAASFPSQFYRTLGGHTRGVSGCAISADSRWVVSASRDQTLKIWNRETGEILHTLQGHKDKVNGCAISADGRWIVSASGDKTLKIWNREKAEIVRTLQGHTRGVSGCAISADGRWVVSASFDGTLKIWNRETGQAVHTLQGHTKNIVNGCAISADGRWVVSTSGDKTLKIWNRETAEIVRILQGHTHHISGCAISANGKFIVSASSDITLKIWNRETGEVMRTLQGHTDYINECAIRAHPKITPSFTHHVVLYRYHDQKTNKHRTKMARYPAGTQ